MGSSPTARIKIPLSYLESSSEKAKNVIRLAYGYRDDRLKKLKIIQASTWMIQFQPQSHDQWVPVMCQKFFGVFLEFGAI